ncbi:hypothetical protein F5Y18DRAFT_240637 [Xylariaceae sp. FL1019]|nr:hypothetical protein F5Y18DRAFT_240637 [Xylariaceae sp. FL1019]
MCGPSIHRPALGGAVAMLKSPSSVSGLPLTGQLLFRSLESQGPTSPGLRSTRGSLRFDAMDDASPAQRASYLFIHASGDLTVPVSEAQVWTKCNLARGVCNTEETRPGVFDRRQYWSIEFERNHTAKIEVGNDGLIGRRVSVWTDRGQSPVAEGIIGWN